MSANHEQRAVVVGSGRVGLRTARMLADRGHEVVAVERHPDRVREAVDAYVATIIEGDATRPSILEQAGLERADVLAALTDTMGTNMAVCMMAKRMDPSIRTVMRSVHPQEEEYGEWADAVVYPERAGARLAVNAVAGDVQSLVEVSGDLDLLEVEVRQGAPVAGRSLDEVSLPEGSLVVSGAAGRRIASADTELAPGETYLLAVEADVAEEVLHLFQG